MELLEREAVLASLTEYAEAARAGEGRLVLLAGEAGVGKTTVLEVLREQLADARWLSGTCDGSFTPRALEPLFDVASAVGGELAQACREEATRERMFRALLDELTGSAGLTVLAIEDVHWADEATLDLLRFLAPRLRQARALLVVTYRDDGLGTGHPLRIVLGELATQRPTRRVGLAPLSRDAVGRLSKGSGIAPAELFALTGGNPFLVAEVIATGPGVVPLSARDAVLARVARLSAGARQVLEAAALLGPRSDVEVLRAVSAATGEVMDECLTAGALVPDAQGFRFRHEIARRAVEEAVPPHRRAELHARILAVLLAAGVADDARLAHHAEGAGDGEAVLRFAPPAGRRASELAAHREAAAQYARAVRHAGAAPVRTRAELLDALASECSVIDRWEEAAEARAAALELWRETGDRLRIGDDLRLLSRTMGRLCRGPDGDAFAEEARTVLEQLPPTVELGWAYANLAGLAMYGDPPASLHWCRQAQAIAEELADPGLLSDVLNTEGCARENLGEDGVPLLEQALQVALAAGREEPAARAYANLQATLCATYRFVEAERYTEEGLAYCEEHDLGTSGNCIRGGHLEVVERLGRWDEAEAICAVELDRRQLSPVNRVGPLLTRAVIRARRGHPDAVAALDEAAQVAAGGEDNARLAFVHQARAEVAWLAGDLPAVRREACTALDLMPQVDPWLHGSLTAWARRGGLEPTEPPAGTSVVAPPYQLLLAGDARGAAELWLQLGCPYDAGLALLDAGESDAMCEALRLFEGLGATAAVAAGQAAMRRLGHKAIPRGRRSETRADRFGLTRREREVLALLCGQLTNADIAQRLFISEKTVDHHVSAVLAKMGVASRRAAARKAAECGLVEVAS